MSVVNRRTHLFIDLMEVGLRGALILTHSPPAASREGRQVAQQTVGLWKAWRRVPWQKSRSSVAGKTSAEGFDAPLMFVGKGVGKCLCLSPVDDAKALHPSLLVFDGLKVLRYCPDVFEATAVSDDVTLPILPRPAPHDLKFLTQFLTQFLTNWPSIGAGRRR